MKHYNLIIFDFDGTLVDTLPDIALHANHVLRYFSLPEQDLPAVRKAIGRGVHELLKDLAPAFEDETLLEEAVVLFKKLYYEKPVLYTKPYSNVPEMLKGPLKNTKKAIVTNKPHDLTHVILKELGLLSYFESVIGMGFTHPPKPDPSSTIYVMEQLKSLPCETVFVGDSGVDQETAKKAGVDFAWVDYGYDTLGESQGRRSFSDPKEWKALVA
jgi:phosphoglycolate phosphatase